MSKRVFSKKWLDNVWQVQPGPEWAQLIRDLNVYNFYRSGPGQSGTVMEALYCWSMMWQQQQQQRKIVALADTRAGSVGRGGTAGGNRRQY